MLSPLKLNTFGPQAQSNLLTGAGIPPTMMPTAFGNANQQLPPTLPPIGQAPQPAIQPTEMPQAFQAPQPMQPVAPTQRSQLYKNFLAAQAAAAPQMRPLPANANVRGLASVPSGGTPTGVGSAIIAEAKKYLDPKNPLHNAYNQQGTIPGGWDCSSFVRRVVKNVTGKDITRSTYSQQPFWKKQGFFVSGTLKGIQPGDPIYFKSGRGQHTGIYIGGGKMIDNGSSKRPIRIGNVWKSGVLGYGALNRWIASKG